MCEGFEVGKSVQRGPILSAGGSHRDLPVWRRVLHSQDLFPQPGLHLGVLGEKADSPRKGYRHGRVAGEQLDVSYGTANSTHE